MACGYPRFADAETIRYQRVTRLVPRETQRRAAEHRQIDFPSRIDRSLDQCRAVDFAANPSYEIVIAGDPAAEDTQRLLRAVQALYLPNKVLLLRPDDASEIADLAPYTEDQVALEGKATAYVCRNFTCSLPTSDVEKMLSLLDD